MPEGSAGKRAKRGKVQKSDIDTRTGKPILQNWFAGEYRDWEGEGF